MSNLSQSEFWSLVNKDCWMWSGSISVECYGRVVVNKEVFSAHRIAWSFTNGPIPDGLQVCHRCDNRLCVNPDNLFLGTMKENIRDCIKKGRNNRGEKVWRAKLTESGVRMIRSFAQNGWDLKELGRWFGVSPGAISSIVHYRTWRHVK